MPATKLARATFDRFCVFFEDFIDQTLQHPVDRLERIWPVGPAYCAVPSHACVIEVRFFNERIHVSSLRTLERGKGYGTACLKWLCALADKYGLEIELTATPFGRDPQTGELRDDLGPMLGKRELRAWYRRYGFKPEGIHDVRKPRQQKVES